MTRKADLLVAPLIPALLEGVGEVITFKRIAFICGISEDSDIQNGAKVRISHARRRLPHLRISSVRNVGYLIERQQIEAEES